MYCGPVEDYSEEYVRRHYRQGFAAGIRITVQVTSKAWDDIYFERSYSLKRAKTLPAVKDQWGEIGQPRYETALFPHGDWIDMRDGAEDMPVPKDAERVNESYVTGKTEVQATEDGFQVLEDDEIVAQVDDEDLAIAIAAGTLPKPDQAKVA